MTVGLVWAEAAGGVIGNQGGMPWHLPEDLAHFKQLTLGNPVIMGRRTWESLPPRFRPLPGRQNIVVTRQSDWAAEGALIAHSVDDALALAGAADAAASLTTATDAGAPGSVASVWVIGGAEIFAAVIDRADRLEVTQIRADVEGDTLAPVVDEAWATVAVDPAAGWHTSASGHRYRFVSYERRRDYLVS